ncbi:TetR family transcriptional regulator [Streptomyces sp. NPDC052207]|uniref:TetR family transcriptional regulator n=1 Tax=Streptomyces sp. NPDC052207 TaxID=3155418 RepID=UPI00342A6907
MDTHTDETAERGPRPRDSRATKKLLLGAATVEFAEFGLSGARIDRIAERAGANKRLLYVYFGDKEKLFEAVLRTEIGRLVEQVPLVDGDLVSFAGTRFDYMLAHPETARLAAWRRFEHSHFSGAETDSYRERIEAVAAAQRAGRLDDSLPAVDLFAMVLRLTESWLDAPPALRATCDAEPMSEERLREHRDSLLEAVRRITDPR